MTCTIISTGEELSAEIKNENEPPYPLMKSRLHELIGSLYCQGYDRFCVNCEYGVPLWAAECIAVLKRFNAITLHIVIPYENQAEKWPEAYRDRYYSIHQRADEVTMASTQYHPDCYSKADQLMTDESDLLVICGNPGALPQAVQYAGAQQVAVCYISVTS